MSGFKFGLLSVLKGVGNALAEARRFAKNLNHSIYYKRKIANILAGLPSAQPFALKQSLWPSYNDTRWHRAYAAANGIVSDHYVPEDLFYVTIEAKLNPRDRAQFYLDKNNLDKLNFPCTFPGTLGRVIAGRFLDVGYRPADPYAALHGRASVVVKPSLDTGGGKNIAFMAGDEAAAFAMRACGGRSEYIFQEPIEQSPRMAFFAPHSVNTIRVMTMLDGDAPRGLSSVLRMGRKGARVDNQAAGGISCGVSQKGRLIARAYDKAFQPVTSHPDTGVVFRDVEVPGYDQATALCLRLHGLMPEIGMVSWDVAIDRADKPLIIEFNIFDQEINFHQIAHGPLFGDRLPDILQRTRPRVFMGFPVG